MILVGLAGQIASGKSLVAAAFSQQGARIISGDQIGKDVVEGNPQVLGRLQREFGPEIITPSGKLRRKKLARIVFADPAKMRTLNRIVHPHLLKEIRRRVRQYRRRGDVDIVVVDAALVFDWGLEKELDFVIVVESTQKLQIERLGKLGMSETEARERIRSQIPRYRQRKKADMVIRNNGTLSELRKKALRTYKKLLNLVDKR